MWMDPAWDGSQGPRPSTASIRVRELSWQGLNNPCPQNKRLGSHGEIHRERRMEEHLSPARLQALARVDDLQLVRVLEMCVDTRKNSLGNFGVHLPNLIQLKLNHSCLGSLRDLGTSLGHLQVLWLARCGLSDLDGIGSFLALKELYVSYNNISDLSPLCLLEQLEVLDLEGNNVEDLGQMRYLQLCPRLATLTLEGNLVCLKPDPDPSNKIVPMEPPYGNLTQPCLCLRPSHGLCPCWSLRSPCLKVCFLRTQPQKTMPATSPMVLVKFSVGTPPKACGNVDTSTSPLLHRQLEFQQERLAQAPAQDPQRASEEQEDQTGPKTSLIPPRLTSELSRTSGFHLIPSPPKYPMPPESGSSSSGRPADLPFRGRRLRVLGSLGPSLAEGSGLGERLAAVTALRALEVSSGPSHRVQGCPDPKSALGPAACSPGLHCLHHLNPIPPAHSLP
ncbi:leucine-rich repeat-containing protein 56 isoform X5 [Peromyscus californicus insignis]|uniref:leucine-rich repeat-containing protein 56 isoform X5 n=1 Tax=Peromyscus californicus insignis TaxID=564181 RepID=UPI0022A68F3F|nr:leucine-rich repeat-containing protein 56 isoform X5 [Peromyscus californicus insignis]